MLPAKGYLRSLNCPFYNAYICERPYCHYKHRKNIPENISYKPTPIAQLNKIKRVNEMKPIPMYNDQFIDDFLNDPDIYEEDSENELEQCKRIFNEYKPPPPPPATIKRPAIIPFESNKKRCARIARAEGTSYTSVSVRNASKSKFPINIRTKFYQAILKEYLKIMSGDEAREKSLDGEFKCYTKCSLLQSYKNAVMLHIHHIRHPPQITTFKQLEECNLIEFAGKLILTEEQLSSNGFPPFIKPIHQVEEKWKQCCRCKKLFQLTNNSDCIYHPMNRVQIKGEARFSCCQQTSARNGCAHSPKHVYESNPESFVRTLPKNLSEGKIFAVDCEMVYTTHGLELARVTVVDFKLHVCYDKLVRPFGDILDCNTRFSGLTETDLMIKTRLTDVQAALLAMFDNETILVGHSFESDLKALRMIHSRIVDTSVLFPHKMGPPKKRALRSLASDYLKKIIQNNESGHDSTEDAVTCMELLIWKMNH